MLLSFIASILPLYPKEVAAETTYAACMSNKNYDYLNPPTGFPKCSLNGKPFNQKLFDDMGVAAYGKPEQVDENRGSNDFNTTWQDLQEKPHTGRIGDHPYFKKNGSEGEFRYYGWDKNGNLYSNPYFLNDANSGVNPSLKKWIYRPWQSNLTVGMNNRPSGFSPLFGVSYKPDDIYGDGPVAVAKANSIVKSRDIKINHQSTNALPKDSRSPHNLFDFMYVEQDPTVWAAGQGRMYHENANGSIWYQSFEIDKSTGKKHPGNEPVISYGKLQTDLNKLPTDFKWKLNLKGELNDDDYYNDRYKKVEYYTRWDLVEWKLKLEVSYKGHALSTVKEFSSKVNGDVSISNQKKIGRSEIDVPLNKTGLVKGDKITFYLTATSYYQDGNGTVVNDQTTTTKEIQLGKEIIPIPDPQPDLPPEEEGPPPLVCKPDIPGDAFDIVAFPASDNTDMSRVSSRSVAVNGVTVDAELFFSGGYVFGDEADGLATVTMKWVPKPGEDKNGADMCDTHRIVNVHDTKPRAQFKMFGGSFKENRKMAIDNTSTDPNANDPFVQAAYPIIQNDWSWGASDGSDSDRRIKVDTGLRKEFLYKKSGEYQVTLIVTNALGRTSDPYVLDFSVIPDYAPAVIFNPYSSQIARDEAVTLQYDAVSTDGDVVTNQRFKVYYDQNGNESYSQLIDSFNTPLSEYKPTLNKLGKYRITVTVEEEFGQETFTEFMTSADKRQTTTQFEFEIDNYLPYSDLYTDIPSIRQQVDAYFMLDKNLAQSKIDYIKGNGVTINNQLRLEGIDPEVNLWDMHTYTYSQAASTVYHSGSYPSNTYYYCSAGYCGTLYRTSASDNGSYYDYGSYVTVVDVPAHSVTVVDVPGHYVTVQIPWCEGSARPGAPSYSHSPPCSLASNQTTKSESYWVPTTYKTVNVPATYKQVWSPNVQWVSNWYGTYSGTIYKDVRQSYANPFSRTTSGKYIIYLSDGTINELADFNKAKAQSDARVILIGTNAIKAQTAHEHFILSTGRTIEEIIQKAVDYIASKNPPTASQTVLVNETFHLLTEESDVEDDRIILKQTQYVHDENFYDNPAGHTAYAHNEYKPSGWGIQSLMSSFAKPGKYTVYRRVKDQPSTDPLLGDYSYYSNESETIIKAHRKPIALAAMDWTYDTNCSCYQTTWVDGSYDLDHNISDPVNKGIVERKIRYQFSGEWFYKIPDELQAGSYHLEYLVKDVEGAWSDPFILDFVLAATPPPQLKAKLKPVDGAFTLTGGVPAGENLLVYELWTRFPLSVGLQFRMGSFVNKTVPYFTGTKIGSNIDWADVLTQIPVTTPDASYTYRIQANGSNGTSAFKDFTVKVLTPIQLVPDIRDAEGHPANTVVVGYPFTLAAGTTEYPHQTTVIAFKGKSFQRSLTLSGTVSSVSGAGSKQWSVPFTPTGVIPDGTYTFEWTARTPNGNVEIRSLQVQLVNNTPPFGDFKRYTYDAADTAMPIYEGDLLHVRSIGVGDNERDPLTVRYELIDPTGAKRYDETFNSLYPYASSGPDFQLPSGPAAIGTWTIRQTISDGKAAPVAKTQSMLVRSLGIQGYVNHTDAWETNRLRYNDKHPNAQRPANWFWAGEAFVLEATITDTGTSGTKPVSVKAAATPALQQSLSGASPQQTLWKGLLRDGDTSQSFEELAQGPYSFVFTVTYSNGTTKTSIVPIRVEDTVDNYVQVHRIQ